MTPPRRRERGFTLVETVISVAIMAVVVQTAATTTLLMTKSTDSGQKHTRLVTRIDQVLERIRTELRATSRDTDPATNQPYVSVSGTKGMNTLTYRRITQFGDNGVELVPVWSTPIELFRHGRQLVRRQDGHDQVLLNDVETLDFSIDALGRVDAQIGMVTRTDDFSGLQRMVDHVRVTPQR